MKLAKSLLFASAAIALAFGSAYADDKAAKAKDKDPGFNNLDKNNDGYLSRAEAKGNPDLSKHFKEVDKNNDGKLSRAEYLAFMGKKDLNTAKNKVSNALSKDKDKDKSAATGSSKAPK
jgi:Ca2+-binding EF-hand superfamily protein